MNSPRIAAGIVIVASVITAVVILSGFPPIFTSHLTPYNGSYGYQYRPLGNANAIAACSQQTTYACNANGLCVQAQGGSYTNPTCNNQCQAVQTYACNANNQCVKAQNGNYTTSDCNQQCTGGTSITSVSVTCSPSTIQVGTTANCTSTVVGTGNLDVDWTLSPAGFGTISRTGVDQAQYKAPITQQGTVSVIATSQQDSSKIGSSTITVTQAPPPATTTITITLTLQQKGKGTATYSDFNLTVTDAGSNRLSGPASQSQQVILNQGDKYTVAEATTTNSANYTISLGGTCNGTAQSSPINCGITNTYVAPTPPGKPNNLQANSISSSEIDLSWSASNPQTYPIASYNIYRDGLLAGNTGSPTTLSFSDTGLTASTQYSYYVTALDNQGDESASSSVVKAMTQGNTGGPTIQATLFGLTINAYGSQFPTSPFGVLRFWDTTPNVAWELMNSAAGVYNWTPLENYLKELHSNDPGAVGFYTLARTPKWASSQPNDNTCLYGGNGECDLPSDINPDGTGTDLIWRTWVRDIASHVKSLDPNTYAPIKYWEPWNEPDHSDTIGNYGKLPNNVGYAGTYAQLVRITQDTNCIITGRVQTITTNYNETCAHVLQSVGLSAPIDPTAYIVMPATHPTPAKSVTIGQNFLYCNSIPPPAPSTDSTTGNAGAQAVDIINFHIKPGNVNTAPIETELTTMITTLKGILKPNELAKPFFDGEAGYSGPGWADEYANNPQMQASFVPRFFLMLSSLGVQSEEWYDWDNSNFLWKSNGGTTVAGIAFNQTYNWMVGATLSTPCSVNGTIWTCGLTRTSPANYQAEAIWDFSPTYYCTNSACPTHNMTVPKIYTDYLDLTGKKTAIQNNSVPVGIKPILLENQ